MRFRDIMRVPAVAALSCAAAFAQTAGQDLKHAGNDTKQAAKNTGHAQGAANKTR